MTEFLPSEFFLAQNYPNPFREKTVIKYCVAFKTRVMLRVYNSKGELIEKLVDEEKKPGAYEVEFNSTSCHSGESRNLESGTYILHLEAGKFISEKKMVLQK